MDNLDDDKKKIIKAAEDLLKQGKSQMSKIQDLFEGSVGDEMYMNIWLDKPDDPDDFSEITIHYGFMTFTIPSFMFSEFVHNLNLADIKRKEIEAKEANEEGPPEPGDGEVA